MPGALSIQIGRTVRVVFSHSALREGWDNPNVFVMCMLKHSDNTISRRQEVGRGLRISVNKNGDRMDPAATVHDINVLTVVASESYKDFVGGLQKEIAENLSERPRQANAEYFEGKSITVNGSETTVSKDMAKRIERYLIKNDYIDDNDGITQAYHDAREAGTLAAAWSLTALTGPPRGVLTVLFAPAVARLLGPWFRRW